MVQPFQGKIDHAVNFHTRDPFGVAQPFDLAGKPFFVHRGHNLREASSSLASSSGRENEIHRSSSFLCLVDLGRAGDGHHRIPRKIYHPVQRNLPDGRLVLLRNFLHNGNQRTGAFDSALQGCSPYPAFLFQCFRVLVILPCQEPPFQRGVGNDGHAQFLRRFQHTVLFNIPVQKAVIHLVDRQG